MTEQQQEVNEVGMLMARVNELSNKLSARSNLLGEVDMAGPSLKLYFKNEDERHIVTMVAAQHGMTLPQYVMECALQNTNAVLQARQAEVAAANEAKTPVEAEQQVDVK